MCVVDCSFFVLNDIGFHNRAIFRIFIHHSDQGPNRSVGFGIQSLVKLIEQREIRGGVESESQVGAISQQFGQRKTFNTEVFRMSIEIYGDMFEIVFLIGSVGSPSEGIGGGQLSEKSEMRLDGGTTVRKSEAYIIGIRTSLGVKHLLKRVDLKKGIVGADADDAFESEHIGCPYKA